MIFTHSHIAPEWNNIGFITTRALGRPLTGDGLDAAFRHERWSATACPDSRTGELVLTATGT